MSRRVSFLSEAFLPSDGSDSGLLLDMAAHLSGIGFQDRAISRGPRCGVSWVRGVRVRQVGSAQSARRSLVATLTSKLAFAVNALLATLREPVDSTLVAVTTPPFNVWVALATSLLRRRPYVLLMHDLYPDIIVKLGILSRYSPVACVWRALNRWSLSRAARIVVIGKDMERIVLDELPARMHDKCIFIPCWVDGEKIRPDIARPPGRIRVSSQFTTAETSA